MKNVLIVSGHNDLNNSLANTIILENLQNSLPAAEFDFLDKLYPDYEFDVKKEQEKLVKADIIVLQFPIFWYSVPSLMKKWFEDIFIHGFSHGSTGKALAGKTLIASFTTGSPAEAYKHGGMQNYTLDEFLPPLIQLAAISGMNWGGYVHTGGVSYASRNDEAAQKEIKKNHFSTRSTNGKIDCVVLMGKSANKS